MLKRRIKLGNMGHTYNPSTGEAEAKASLVYTTSSRLARAT